MNKGRWLSFIVLFLTAIVVLGFNPIVSAISKTVKADYELTNEVLFNQNNEVSFTPSVDAMSNRYVILESDSLKAYDETGHLIWQKEVNSANVLMDVNATTILLAEKKAGDIYLLDANGAIVSSQIRIGEIDTIKNFEEGYIGIFKRDGSLFIYDKKMKFVGSLTLPKGELIDFDINIEKQDIVAMVLDLSRTDFNSKMVIATFNGNIISGSNFIKEVVYDVTCTDETIVVTTDEGVKLYGYDSNLIDDVAFDRTINAFYHDDKNGNLYYQLTNQSDEIDNPKDKETMIILSPNGNILTEFSLEDDTVKGIQVLGDRIMVETDRSLMVYNTEGKSLESYNLEESEKQLVIASDSSFAMVFDHYLDIYYLK